MCGIAGVILRERQIVERAVGSMIRAQQHRGPDDSGSAFFDASRTCVGLGHRRLSILDLSPQGHQPMTHPQFGGVLVFNGEIYNYAQLRRELSDAGVPFRGHSDTEVLLHLLARDGPKALERLAGMYAFAYYDPRHQTLLIARDPLGIKPLYIHQTDHSLVFASEVRGLLASGLVKPEVDRAGVATILAYGAPQEPLTIIKDVRMFPAGHWQQIEVNDLRSPVSQRRQKHWNFPQPQPITSADAVHGIKELLETSVRDHLVADVPVGVFLSSGLDSTIIAGLAAKHTADLRTFTVGFADEPDMSEAPMASETARLLGVRHTTLNIQGSDALPRVRQWLTNLDQPSMDGLNVYMICQAVREAQIKVILSGQGGDELFGGYPSFSDIPRLRNMMRILRWLPRRVTKAVARTLTMNRSPAVQQKMLDISTSDGSLRTLYLLRRRAMSNSQLQSLGFNTDDLGLSRDYQPHEAVDSLEIDNSDPVWSISELESRIYQQNVLLRDSDANSMAHSLELRVPFLDRRVIDFAQGIPGNVRLPEKIANKHLLRVAFAEHLRPELLRQSKRGFQLPINRWLAGPLREMAEAGLDRLKQSGLVAEDGVDDIWQSFRSHPQSPIWSRAWTLCVTGVYLTQLSDKAEDIVSQRKPVTLRSTPSSKQPKRWLPTPSSLTSDYQSALEYHTKLNAWKPDDIPPMQLAKLAAIWADAINDVPYYRKLVESAAAPREITSWADFKKIPVLTKQYLRANLPEFIRISGPPDKFMQTAGSSGLPVKLGVWKKENVHIRVAKLVPWIINGYHLGDPVFLVWGHSHLLGTGWRRYLNHAIRMGKDALLNYRRARAYVMGPSDCRKIAKQIIRARPVGMIGYASALDLLGRYTQEFRKEFRATGIRFILSTSEMPPRQDTFSMLEDLFGCPVIEEFGGVDFGHVAMRPRKGPWSVFPDLNIVESQKEADEGDGESILVSTLYLRYTPLIRYKQGDLLRGPMRLANDHVYEFQDLGGRINEAILMSDGRSVHSVAVFHCVHQEPIVLNIQLYLRDAGPILRLVVSSTPDAEFENRVLHRLRQVHPDLTETKLEFVNDLTTNRAGKRRWMIDERTKTPPKA